jgi:hypothetical protein
LWQTLLTVDREWESGVRPWDLPMLRGGPPVLGLAALIAAAIPARRAATVSSVQP